MSDINKVKEEILKMIRKKRAEISPEILDQTREKILGKAEADKLKAIEEDGVEIYDKDAAAKVLKLFIHNHDDPDGFEKELIARIKNKLH